MLWQIPVALRVIVAYFISPVVIKKISKLPSRTRNLVWQYFFAAIMAMTIGLIAATNIQAEFLSKNFLFVAIIGAFNAFGCYCQWRAIAISLSRTSIFTWADDLIAIVLGFIILGESQVLNFQLVLGLIIVGVACVLFTLNALTEKKKQKAEKDKPTVGLLFWVGAYSVIWGVANFSLRYFSLQGMSVWNFTSA